jgi:hypothetical protein
MDKVQEPSHLFYLTCKEGRTDILIGALQECKRKIFEEAESNVAAH